MIDGLVAGVAVLLGAVALFVAVYVAALLAVATVLAVALKAVQRKVNGIAPDDSDK